EHYAIDAGVGSHGVMLERLLTDGKTEAGIYASAYRLLDASNMLGFLFAGLLLPMFARMIKQATSITSLLQLSFQMIWIGSLALSMATYLYREEIMFLLYTEATPYWGEILGHLMWTFVAVSTAYIYGTLLTANGNVRVMNITFLAGVVLNVLLNLILIPQYKAMGAVIATLITQYFVTIALVVLVQRVFRLSPNVPYLLKISGFTVLYIGSAWLLHQQLSVHWFISFCLIGLLSLPFAFLLRLLNVSALLSILQSR
ncbi:MAG: polysaccharide biosynthesis C-terminal domain-containing protein, partial [Bacteroidota bacterium]